MKYFSTKFEEYINEFKKNNFHKEILDITNSFDNELKNQNNLIFYGPSGVGKYTQALNFIKKFSPTELRFERKINFPYNKKEYIFKVSDIHFEIDMQLLGCNAKVLFNEFFYHIQDILSTRTNCTGIILCKNFHYIHNELLEIFYSYMQNLKHKNLKIIYIIITEHVSFIPNNILDKCLIIPVKKPSKSKYMQITNNKCIKQVNTITNIKDLTSKQKELSNINLFISKKIVEDIVNYKELDFKELREKLYNIFTYNLDIYHCIYFIIKELINKNLITYENSEKIFLRHYKFFKLYNNNYRPIYHLESFVYYLCIVIHGL